MKSNPSQNYYEMDTLAQPIEPMTHATWRVKREASFTVDASRHFDILDLMDTSHSSHQFTRDDETRGAEWRPNDEIEHFYQIFMTFLLLGDIQRSWCIVRCCVCVTCRFIHLGVGRQGRGGDGDGEGEVNQQAITF